MNDDVFLSLQQEPTAEFARSLHNRLLEQEAATSASRWRVRVIVKPLIAAAAVAALFAVPAVRASAESLLALFRVRTFVGIPVDRSRMTELARQVDVQALVGSQVTVLQAPGQPVPVETIEAATARAGFVVQEPRDLPVGSVLQRAEVSGPGALRATADATRLEQVMDALQIDDLSVPAGLDGQVVNVETSPVVVASYNIPGLAGRIRLVQSPVPRITLPPNVDMPALGEIALRLLGIGKVDAHAMAQTIDWGTTVLVPIPADARSVRQVDVNGSSALLVERGDADAPQSMMMWSSQGQAFVMTGATTGERLAGFAASVR
jgi:hypothetical protein